MRELLHPRLPAALANYFTHRSTVQRATVAPDELGADKATWGDHLTGVVCLLVLDAQRNPITELAESPVISSLRLIVNGTPDVRIGDQVSAVVRKKDGSLVDAGPFRVLAVLPKADAFLVLELERVG